MNQQIRDCGKELSERGPYVTLVPDLYRGKVTADDKEANHYMSDLDWPGAVADIQGAARYHYNIILMQMHHVSFY